LYAAKLLAVMNPLNRIILVARNEEKAAFAKEQVVSVLPEKTPYFVENIIPIACDHTSQESIREFNETLRRKLKETYNVNKWAVNGIDVMCLNAAVLMAADSEAQFTADGTEVTFQTNFLASFLIVNLTADLINPGGRVVISSSGLYHGPKLNLDGMVDPATGKARNGFSMINGKPFHYKESYSLSKVCTVAFCIELNRRLKARNAIANSFSPGLVTTSGLFRNQDFSSHPGTAHSEDIMKKERTVEYGGGALVFMAIADAAGRRGGEYWRDLTLHPHGTTPMTAYGKEFSPAAVSGDAADIEKREKLWKLSAELAGVPNSLL
jgi:NAD(P)-dependent dehydrogenase (short-subunit alcohol dehydrogenase family)